jgi:hypothetical protein
MSKPRKKQGGAFEARSEEDFVVAAAFGIVAIWSDVGASVRH